MKKILLALAVLAVATASAFAGVGINWVTMYGAYTHDALNVTSGDDALLDSYSVTWQLIYAGANNASDAPGTSLGGAGIADDYVTGDDVVWGSRTIAQGGGASAEAGDDTVWDNWMLQTAGDAVYQNLGWSTAGYTFQRVFEGTPAANSWYFETPLNDIDLSFTGGATSPENFVIGSGSAGFQPNAQVPAAPVPEPATMALLGLGALTLAIRRRRA